MMVDPTLVSYKIEAFTPSLLFWTLGLTTNYKDPPWFSLLSDWKALVNYINYNLESRGAAVRRSIAYPVRSGAGVRLVCTECGTRRIPVFVESDAAGCGSGRYRK